MAGGVQPGLHLRLDGADYEDAGLTAAD